MKGRQTNAPRQWLVVAARSQARLPEALKLLPSGSGLLVTSDVGPSGERHRLVRQLRRAARRNRWTIVDERDGEAVRVHDVRELRRAMLARTRLLLLSPLYPTGSHPERRALPRMRAAALARLGGRQVVALGGMDAKRFKRIERLGFVGWAAIDAWTGRQGIRT